MFGRKKERVRKEWDSSKKTPAIRSSICTGEQVAGFIDKETGAFEDVMLLKTPKDLEVFREEYGIGNADMKTIY